jgi:hypothetical protein
MRVKFGNSTKDVNILEVTPENYIVPVGEENTYHCRIEQTQFNPRNGKRLSRPRIQKFDAKMYPSLARNLKQQGWDVVVLYDPTEYLAQQDMKRKELQEMTYKQRQEAEAKRKAAEREALKKELLAELKEMGMLKAPAKEQKPKTEPKTDGSKKK